MLQADSVSVTWERDKKRWAIRVPVGAEVIRRPLPKAPETTAEAALRSLAVDMAKEEGYALDPAKSAIRELGLKLESRKAPVDYLVIDHAGKIPTEN